jgi:KDO2-lipid IV(A) lauroyltransferase
MTSRLVLLLLASVAAGFFFLRFRRQQDYRKATFYKLLYQPHAFDLAIAARRILGRRASKVVARALGVGYALTHFRVLRAIRSNIALLDPSRASLANAIRLCIHQALNFREYAELGAADPQHVLEMLGTQSGLAHIEAARELGKGCLFVTGHFGFFELGGLVISQMGYPIATLTLPEPSSALTRWRAGFRKRWGVETIVVGNDPFSAVEITRLLRSGAMVALLADRPFDGHSVSVDLPHGRIPFSTSPVLLSLLSGSPIIAVGIWRQADGKFCMEASPAFVPKWLPEGREATLAHFTKRLANEYLVPIFSKAPEQWHHYSRLAQ